MYVPKNISINHIQASIFRFLNKVRPHLPQTKKKVENVIKKQSQNRERKWCESDVYKERDLGSAARVVNGARDQHPALPINHQRSIIVRHIGTKRRRSKNSDHQQKNQTKPIASHGFLFTNNNNKNQELFFNAHFLKSLLFHFLKANTRNLENPFRLIFYSF